jgi:REP-associated tyrosine transposase
MAGNFSIHKHIGRKTPAKGVHLSPDGPNIIWVTILSKNRRPWLTQNTIMEMLHELWLNKATAWLVSDYLLMPDHIHFFCAPYDLQVSIERWYAYWKDQLSKTHKQPEWILLRGGFHHRIRSGTEYTEKWNYMMQNPIRKNLVQRIEDWPWKGRVHDIRWE